MDRKCCVRHAGDRKAFLPGFKSIIVRISSGDNLASAVQVGKDESRNVGKGRSRF